MPYFRYSIRLPGVFISGESITNMNNSTNIQTNSKLFLGMPIGTRRSCFMKKKQGMKNLVTLSLWSDSVKTFFVSGFFIKPLLLVLIDTMRSNFGVSKIFMDLFIFENDSAVYSPPGSRSERLERRMQKKSPMQNCKNNSLVVDTPGSPDSPVVNTPRSLDSPVMNTPRSSDFLVVKTPGSHL